MSKILAKKTLSKRQTIRKNKQQSSKQTSPNKIHHKSRRGYKDLLRISKIRSSQRGHTPEKTTREMLISQESKNHHKSARLRRVYKNLIRKSKIRRRQRDNTPAEKSREMPNSPESKS